MLQKLSNIKTNRFAQNFLKLFSATLLAQVITIALSPVLTRLYSPEDFGYYSVYTAIVALVVVFATGRYEFAISTAKTVEESEKIFKLVILLTFVSSAILFVIIYMWEELFNQIAGFKAQDHILFYVPITILGLGIMQGLNYYFNKQKDFSHISKSKLLQSVSNGGSSVLFAFLGFHTLGMIWANIFSVLVSNLYNIFGKRLFEFFNAFKYEIKDIKEVAKKYKQYPIFNSTSAFFDILALQAPILVLSRFFSETIVGFYSLTIKIIALPITVISSAVSQVYLSELAEKVSNGERIDLTLKKAFKVLTVIGIFPVVILVFLGPWLFDLVFGAKWREAGELARILAFSYYAKFIVSPLSVVFFVKNAVRLLSIIQFGRSLSTISILCISSIFFDSIYSVLICYAIHEIIFYLIYLKFIFKLSEKI